MDNTKYLGSDLTIEELLKIRSHNILRRNITEEIQQLLKPYIGKVLTDEDKELLTNEICDLGLIKNAQAAFGVLALATKKLENGFKLEPTEDVLEKGKEILNSSTKYITGDEIKID